MASATLKEACIKRPPANYKKQLETKYLGKMESALNVNINANVFPHWRSHASLKGWCAMNYPAVIKNPVLQKIRSQPDLAAKFFNNQEQPCTSSATKLQRPISERKMASPQAEERIGRSQSVAALPARGTIDTIQNIAGKLTAPQIVKIKKKDSKDQAETTSPEPKKKKVQLISLTAKKSDWPTALPILLGPKETCASVQGKSESWINNGILARKLSSAVLTTMPLEHKIKTFKTLNPIGSHSHIQPVSLLQGRPLDKRNFIRREVQQLDDIAITQFENEATLKDKRLPYTILTEERLKGYLTAETTSLNLENHYWVSNNFISKMSHLAPNLQSLSLSRMQQITTRVFADLLQNLTQLVEVDLCDCNQVQSVGIQLLLSKNPSLRKLIFAGCSVGVDDVVCSMLARLTELQVLDISYCAQITDAGLEQFSQTSHQIENLKINGLSQATQLGIGSVIQSCSSTLQDLEMAQFTQLDMSLVFQHLAKCKQLRSLDFAGSLSIDDSAIKLLQQHLDGGLFSHLFRIKIGGTSIHDEGVQLLCEMAPQTEHLELNKLNLTQEALKSALELPSLKFIDFQGVDAATYQFYQEVKLTHPHVLTRKFNTAEPRDPADNGLRVPRRVAPLDGKEMKIKLKRKK